jgi:S1-C subfamily serine protease
MSDGDRLRVRTQDGRLFEGDTVEVVGHDDMTDLCVLRVAADGLHALAWGDSAAARPGDWVMVVGNPLDFAFSVSQGIISGEHRQVGSEVEIEDLIQTTAMINPGSSGGGMVGLDGRLIGIVMAMATRGESWQGLGFAIPEQIARPVADSLIADGFVRRGYLGIQMERITRFAAKRRGLPERDGVLITGLIPEFPASRSSLRVDDIIVGINGETIRDESDVYRQIATRRAGDVVRLEVAAAAGAGAAAGSLTGAGRHVEIKLAERPAPNEIAFHLDQAERRRERLLGDADETPPTLESDIAVGSQEDIEFLRHLGLRAAPWLGDGRGIVLLRVAPGSIAEQAGLRAGDIVLRVDGETVAQVSQLRRRLTEAGESAQLEADRGGDLKRFMLTLP